MKFNRICLSIVIGFILSIVFFSFAAEARQFQRRQSTDRTKSKLVTNYEMPDVTLSNQDGEKIQLTKFIDTDKVIVVDFIFTTCPTICPILSAGMANFQKKMFDKADKFQLISFTIDPEYDRPEELKNYAERYGAKEGWTFLTGSRNDIDLVMRAFDAYIPDKMSHMPLTFIFGPQSKEWTRINGLMSTSELKEEFYTLVKDK